ncbi:hypothetical protein BDD12DRAFT_691987, partial [Trichophaea hybrida]
DQYRHSLVSVFRRFSATCLTIILLVICLYLYSKIENLNKWHQREFNTLAILLTGTMSICIGSLLGYLGCMIRWPILARAAHRARELTSTRINSILEIGSPTGALRLISINISERRWTLTTTIVAIFFFTNIAGRLSVALFGLTFNLVDVPSVDYPIMVSNWSIDPQNSSPHWIIGISIWTRLVNFTSFNDSLGGIDLEHVLEPSYHIEGIKSEVEKDTIKYTYALKEHQDLSEMPSEDLIHSSASCQTLFLNGNTTYDSSGRLSPATGLDLQNGTFTERYLTVLQQIMRALPYNANADIWAMLESSSYFQDESIPRCATISLWICQPCLSDREGNPGIGRLFGVPEAHNNFHTRNLLIYPTKPISRTTIPGTDLVFNMLPYFQQSVPAVSFGIGEVSKQFYFDRNSSDQFLNTSFERRLRRYVTSLVARMPILSIAEADKQLPKVSRDGAEERHYVTTSLDVKWKKVGATIGAIIGWQILAILIVFHYCKRVYIRDNSFLADVRLLQTMMMKLEGGSLSTGEQLATCLDETDAGFTYGAK